MTRILFWKGRAYEAVSPIADNPALAKCGDRLMFRHDCSNGPVIFIGSKNELTAGYVIGLLSEKGQENMKPSKEIQEKARKYLVDSRRTLRHDIAHRILGRELGALWEWCRVHGGELSKEHYASLGDVLDALAASPSPDSQRDGLGEWRMRVAQDALSRYIAATHKTHQLPSTDRFESAVQQALLAASLSPEQREKCKHQCGRYRVKVGTEHRMACSICHKLVDE